MKTKYAWQKTHRAILKGKRLVKYNLVFDVLLQLVVVPAVARVMFVCYGCESLWINVLYTFDFTILIPSCPIIKNDLRY